MVAYEFITSVVVMVLALLAQGFQRPSLFELPGTARVLMFGSGLVFVRAHGALAVIAKDIVSDILLGLAVAVVLASSVGVLVMRDAYPKLHFVTPAAPGRARAGGPGRARAARRSTRTPARASWPCCS